ncbi:class D sortase [Virgibacillus sp. 6R]|uniref:class D sortase n=1 Tax=Metabacillus sp. 22489 TaxID=3453928 RepID=UPI0011A30384
MKKLSIMIIIFGASIFIWNLYFFWQGHTASTEVEVNVEKTKLKREKKIAHYHDIPNIGEEMGKLVIPKLERAFPIYQGTNANVLKKGVGHVPTSALPGENNHSILSGHRDTVFRGLEILKENEKFIVTTQAGEFLYKIKQIRIVDAENQTVMTPKPKGMLTLITCYPFGFIGEAPQRYVITGELISSNIYDDIDYKME